LAQNHIYVQNGENSMKEITTPNKKFLFTFFALKDEKRDEEVYKQLVEFFARKIREREQAAPRRGS
jgi:hypothetical protein